MTELRQRALERQSEIDMAEAAAEYFNVYIRDWPKDQKAAAGRFLLAQAALRMLDKSR